MKLEEKEAEGEVTVTLLGETVDGRVRYIFARFGCRWWMPSFVFVKNVRASMKHPPIHLSAHNAHDAPGQLTSKSNFDLFVLTSRSAKRVWLFISLCFARILIFAVFWIGILAYGYLHIDLKEWKRDRQKQTTGTQGTTMSWSSTSWSSSQSQQVNKEGDRITGIQGSSQSSSSPS